MAEGHFNNSAVSDRTIEQRLFNTDDTLLTAAHGLELMEHWPYKYENSGFGNELLAGRLHGFPESIKHEIGGKMRMGLRILCAFGQATTLALQSLSKVAPGFDEWWAPRSRALQGDSVARFFWDMRIAVAHRGTTGLYNLTNHSLVAFDGSEAGEPTGHFAIELTTPLDGRVDLYELGSEYLETLGLIVSEAWAEFSPKTRSLAPRPSMTSAAAITVVDASGERVIELDKQEPTIHGVIQRPSDETR